MPMKRCFLGILTPILSSPPSPSHISRSTSQDSTENIDGNFESKQDKDHAAQIMGNKLQLPCDRIFRLGDDMLNQFLLGPK